MSKKYILTKDQIESTVTTSEFPPSSTAVQTALATKLATNQGAGNVGKALIVGADGTVAPATLPASQIQSDWTQANTSSLDYIKNKPFVSIGSGLTVTNGIISASAQFQFKIFESLPTAGAEYAQTIALIETETPDTYKQYACVNQGTTESPNWQWVELGSGEFKVEIEQTAAGISINGTALQAADTDTTGLLSFADWNTFNGKQAALTFDATPTAASTNPVTSAGIKTALDLKEDVANRVSSWSGTVSNNKYPTEKLVKDSLDAKVDLVEGTVVLGHDATGYYFNEA